MSLTTACTNILSQLTNLIEQLNESDFVKPCASLGNSSIGQHIRHTLEFFICFETGHASGVINYDKRAHDKLIESDKYIALAVIVRIREFVASLNGETPLKLEVGYDLASEDFTAIQTTTTRELVYNIEHAVHHMAIMKIGIREIAPAINLPYDFGVAASTLRHKHVTPIAR